MARFLPLGTRVSRLLRRYFRFLPVRPREVAEESRIWPPRPSFSIREATLTTSPKMSPFSTMASPVWMPMRILMSRSSSSSRRFSSICCIPIAARTASSGLRKEAMIESPMVLVTVPRKCLITGNISLLCRSSISRPAVSPCWSQNSVERSMSVNRTVTSFLDFSICRAMLSVVFSATGLGYSLNAAQPASSPVRAAPLQ